MSIEEALCFRYNMTIRTNHSKLFIEVTDMLEIIFGVLMFLVFGRLFLFGLRAAWGLTKFVLWIAFLPFTLVFMVLGGLLSLAFPLLLIIGVVVLFTCKRA